MASAECDPPRLPTFFQVEKPIVVFITGQQDCTQADFDEFYKPAIEDAIARGNASFLVGAANGVDAFARKLLWDELKYTHVTVYDKGARNGELPAGCPWGLRNGFADYPARDLEMIKDASEIIGYLFGNALGTGTYRNLLVFHAMKSAAPGTHYSTLTIHPDDALQVGRTAQRGTPFSSKSWHMPPPPSAPPPNPMTIWNR